MKCQSKNCEITKDVQYIVVRNSRRPMFLGHKEYYCQKHLRFRIAELEFTKVAGIFRKEVRGWF